MTAIYDNTEQFDIGLAAEDRIGTPVRRRSKIVRRGLLLAGVCTLGWASYQDPSIWPRGWSVVAPLAQSLADALPTKAAAPASAFKGGDIAAAREPALARASANAGPSHPDQPATTPSLPSRPPPMPSTAAKEDAVPPPAAERQSAEDDARDAAISAMRAPIIDPLQKRAEKVGLHPELSRALLQRLTEADFKTAQIAIGKALAETGDTETFIWPAKATAGATRFRVSFVQGAPADCRRYVVEIAKDGWQTTALPMEKCGVRRDVAKRG